MKITIITIGKASSNQIAALINDFQKRIKLNVQWIIIAHQTETGQADIIKKQESDLIIKRLESLKNSYKILLDEAGEMISSVQLAKILDQTKNRSLNLIFIIGGAYGISDQLRQKVDFTWSLSKLVFPHQIVRLILIEQIYRAISINNNSSYHHQ